MVGDGWEDKKRKPKINGARWEKRGVRIETEAGNNSILVLTFYYK